MLTHYQNRQHAGQILADQLIVYANHPDVLVLALPRGGVPVAFEIAQALHAPLDVFIVRKLGVPGHSELAMGAMAMTGISIFNEDIIQDLKISKEAIQQVIEEEQQELKRRDIAYRGHQPFPIIKDKTIILVDDGIATGASMRAAIKALRTKHPARLIVAVPVADKLLSDTLAIEVDEFICPLRPSELNAVGAWYDNFSQTEDEEVRALLEENHCS